MPSSDIFWAFAGFGLFLFLALAGLALVLWASRHRPAPGHRHGPPDVPPL